MGKERTIRDRHDVAFYASQLCITLRYLSQIRGRLIYPFLHKDEGHDPKGVQKGKILETLFGLSDVNNSI